MKKNIAIIENNKVVNIVHCDTKEEAEAATGLTCVQYTDENPARIGWDFDGTNFIPPTE